MQPDSVFQIIAFVTSIASVILAIVAIWLSVVFFRLSDAASKATTEAAKGIAASVERLQNLFDKLYEGTFSVMRDTVSDMRKHMWPNEVQAQEKAAEEAEIKAEEKLNEIKEEINSQLNKVLATQRNTDINNQVLAREMRGLVERAMQSSRQVDQEAREESDREQILRTPRILRISRMGRNVTAEQLLQRTGLPPSRLSEELAKLEREGIIHLSDNVIGPDTLIMAGSRELFRVGRGVGSKPNEGGGTKGQGE